MHDIFILLIGVSQVMPSAAMSPSLSSMHGGSADGAGAATFAQVSHELGQILEIVAPESTVNTGLGKRASLDGSGQFLHDCGHRSFTNVPLGAFLSTL